ncbi:hypothetical protein HDU97_000719 [Phlyctochytrium planicorne]|nr:hypothetical protein HDU97_000719 [Phlyctochytrium planicorne]
MLPVRLDALQKPCPYAPVPKLGGVLMEDGRGKVSGIPDFGVSPLQHPPYPPHQPQSHHHQQHIPFGSPPDSIKSSSSPSSPDGNVYSNPARPLEDLFVSGWPPSQGDTTVHGGNDASGSMSDLLFLQNSWMDSSALASGAGGMGLPFAPETFGPVAHIFTATAPYEPSLTGSSISSRHSDSDSPEPLVGNGVVLGDCLKKQQQPPSFVARTAVRSGGILPVTPPLTTAGVASPFYAGGLMTIAVPDSHIVQSGNDGTTTPPEEGCIENGDGPERQQQQDNFWNMISAAEKAAIAYHNEVGGRERRKRVRGDTRGVRVSEVWKEEGGSGDGCLTEVGAGGILKPVVPACTKGTSPVFVQNVCFAVQALTSLPVPHDLIHSIQSSMSLGGYVPSILITRLWVHLLRNLSLSKFESLFPYMFTSSVARPMIRRAIVGSLIRGECTGRRREEALKGGRELAELVKSTCNNEDVWTVIPEEDGFRVDVVIRSTDIPGVSGSEDGGEVCLEALAVKKLLYSLFMRGLDADFQREGTYNGHKVNIRWIDHDYSSRNASVRVIYSSLRTDNLVVDNTPVPDISKHKIALAI